MNADQTIDEVASRAIDSGQAAEHLVAYNLLRWGWRVVFVSGGHPMDLLVYQPGQRCVRVQVKSCAAPQKPDKQGSGYCFQTCQRRAAGHQAYESGEIDVFALVALDVERFTFRRPTGKVKSYVPTHAFFSEDPRRQLDDWFGGTTQNKT